MNYGEKKYKVENGLDPYCPRNALIYLMQKEQKRVNYEWNKWDGSYEHGIQIVDAQCDRIDEAKERIGCPNGYSIPCHLNNCNCIR
jgi:hypothetical protein